jgi:hypothetical protein
MSAPQIKFLTTSERGYGIAAQAVVGEAPIPPTIVVEKEVTDSLTAWLEHQDNQAIAGKFYEIGQVGFRHGIRLQKLVKVIRRWTEEAVVSKSPSQPCRNRDTRNQKERQTHDPTTEFLAFVRHYLITGYHDAAR